MAVLANQREYVRRPGALVPRYGLFTVAQAMGTLVEGTPVPQHAGQGGVEYETAVCSLPTCFETNCIDTLGTKPAGSSTSTITADPFVVLTSLSCGSVGLTDELLRERLRERAIAGEQALVERTFSTGDCGVNPSLANSTPVVTALAASANIVDAFSLLESTFYAVYGLPAVIHLPEAAGPYLAQALGAWRDSAGIWRTSSGSYVSIGNYAGSSPVGVAPGAGTTWIYITSQVNIWRAAESDVFYTPLAGALNRATNQVNGYREREYIVGYECPAFATLTTLVVV